MIRTLVLLCWFGWCLSPVGTSDSVLFAQTTTSASAEKSSLASATADRQEFEFEKFGGIEYAAGENYRLTLDVYVPEGTGPHPAILAVHGGAWRSGSKFVWFRHARKLARAGFVVVAINYRKAPMFQFPAQVHDCKAAIRWMRKHCGEYKIDPDQIGAIGYSAGGHLAAMLGTTDPQDGLEGDSTPEDRQISTRLQAVASGGAVCEFSWIDEKSKALCYWLGKSRGDAPEVYNRASPTSYITPDDPPFYFFHGGKDWVVPDSSPRTMHAQLQKKSVNSKYDQYDEMGHMALFSHIEAMDPVIDFFNRTLKRRH